LSLGFTTVPEVWLVGVATAILAALVTAAAAWDLRNLRIPDPLNLLLAATGFAANWALGNSLADSLIGAAAGYGVILAANLAYRRLRGRDGVGMGDAKMLAGAGAWVGWSLLPFVLLAASLLGIAFALARRLPATGRIPFGPFIGVGLLLAWSVAACYRLFG
jgi:leader peptidase (prepilin peptidase)/N-methyltransferase